MGVTPWGFNLHCIPPLQVPEKVAPGLFTNCTSEIEKMKPKLYWLFQKKSKPWMFWMKTNLYGEKTLEIVLYWPDWGVAPCGFHSSIQCIGVQWEIKNLRFWFRPRAPPPPLVGEPSSHILNTVCNILSHKGTKWFFGKAEVLLKIKGVRLY